MYDLIRTIALLAESVFAKLFMGTYHLISDSLDFNLPSTVIYLKISNGGTHHNIYIDITSNVSHLDPFSLIAIESIGTITQSTY